MASERATSADATEFVTEPEVLYEVSDGVALITLNRPDHHNAWTPDLQEEFFDQLDRAAADELVRAIVVTAAGRRFFCPGADMSVLQEYSDIGLGDGVQGRRFLTHPLTIPKPIVGAINGSCAGFGFVLTAMFDVRFASKDARFTTSFARRGVCGEHTITYLLPRLVGLQRALDLLLSGRLFGADDALRFGYLLEVVEPDDLLDVALEYARELAQWCSPMSMAVIRHQVYDDLDNDLPTARQRAIAHMVRSFELPDLVEGISSYLDRRPPAFAPLPPGFSVSDEDVEVDQHRIPPKPGDAGAVRP